MGRNSFTLSLLLIFSLLWAAACGSAGSVLEESALDPSSEAAVTAAGSGGFSGLPGIPLDTADDRAAAEAAGDPAGPPPPEQGQAVVLGKDYLQMALGVVEGDSLVLSSPAAEEETTGGLPELAYGLYKVPGMLGRRPLSLNIECTPAGLGQNYFVGMADYTNSKWHWFGPINLPEFQLDLRNINRQWVTNLGNAYFIIVCPPGMGATHAKTTVVYGMPQPGDPPGFPYKLVATDGQLAEKVGLSWTGGQGVSSYQIFRKPARHQAEWTLLGETAETHFVDQPLPDYKLFYYRVRSVNANGNSAWSNVDSGFAGGGEDPCIIKGEVATINGEPVPGVRVALVGCGEEAMRLTGPDGKFFFGDLPPGQYIVAPFKPEFDFAPQYAVADLTAARLADLHFNALPEAPFHRIWGFVYEYQADAELGSRLSPMAGVTVQAKLIGNPDSLVTVESNADGFYHFEDLPEGIYAVRAVLDGYGFLPQFHEVVVNGHNRPDRRDFIGQLLPVDEGGDAGGAG